MRNIPEHFFDYKLIEVLIDMIQDNEQKIFTSEDIAEVFYLLVKNFPDEGITMEDLEEFYNKTNEEVDVEIHSNVTGINY